MPPKINLYLKTSAPKTVDFTYWAGLFFLIAACLIVNFTGLNKTGFWWTDESRHAMHGAFFVDFMRHLPISNPYDYVKEYFAQYPALAFNWYLPLFPVLMGLVMTVFGVSEISAHATIIATWLIGVLAWYHWLAGRFGWKSALAACMALISMPVVVLWGRSVMLEAPAVAMCMVSVFFFQRYLDQPGQARAIMAGFVLFLTLLVKQTTLFILPVLLAYAVSYPMGRQALMRKEALWGVALVFLAVSLIALHALLFGPAAALSGEVPVGSGAAPLWSWQRWALFATALQQGMGSFVSALSALGLIWSISRPQSPVALPLAWLLFSYLWCTYLAGAPDNSMRYAFYAMPAAAFFAVYGMRSLNQGLRWVWTALVIVAVGFNYANAMQTPHRFVAGYAEAARVVSSLPNTGTILFAGKHDGNFIFHLRQLDPNRQRVILRADKVLVDMSVHKYFGVRSNVGNQTDVYKVLNDYGVRWIVLESRDLVGLREFKLLQHLMASTDFRLVSRIPIETNVPEFKNTEITIYENLGLVLPQNSRLRINYPYLGKSFEFTFIP